MKTALRTPYVVQEAVEPVFEMFPLLQYGHLEMRKMRIDLHPHTYLGKVQGCLELADGGDRLRLLDVVRCCADVYPRRKMRTILLGLAAGLALLAQTPAKRPAAAGTRTRRCKAGRTAPPRALLNPALLKAKAPDILKPGSPPPKATSWWKCIACGRPLGADRFYNLVKNGFFTDAASSAPLPGFVVQFGISAWPPVKGLGKRQP